MIETASPQARLFSAQEVADELGVAERTVRRWITSELLPATRRGRTFQIDIQEARSLHNGSSAGRTGRQRAVVGEVSQELAELRGRYLEVRDRVADLERLLADEQRRAARLEVLLEQHQAA